MSDYFYWEDILDLTEEVEEECAKTIAQIKYGEHKSARLKKLKGHKLWSARGGYGLRLLFTVISVGGKDYLQFVEISYDHYKDSRIMNNPKLLKKFREKRERAQEVRLSKADRPKPEWEDADGRAFAKALAYEGRGKAIPVSWYNHHPIILTHAQREAQCIRVPALLSGLAGSGKTSTMLLQLPKLRTQYERIVCITNTPGLRNDMQKAWNALPQATEPGSPVEFLTWLEWAERCGLNLAGKTVVGEAEFKAWYQKNARDLARRHGVELPQIVEPPKTRDEYLRAQHMDAEAFAMYQEMRIAFGYTLEEYQGLGTRFSLLPKDDDSRSSKSGSGRRFVHEILLSAWEKECSTNNHIDPSGVKLDPGVLDGLLWVEEAQDFSCRQLRDLLKFTGEKQQFIACAGEYQRLNDSLPFVDHLQQMVHAGGMKLSRAVLPGSFRVPSVLEGPVQWLMDGSVKDAGGVQDRQQVRKFESTLSAHAVPGNAHWFASDTLAPELLHAIRTRAAGNSDFVVLTCEEHKAEARLLFGDDVQICTVEEVKGMQFKEGVLFRLLDTPQCANICNALKEQNGASCSSSNHRPKDRIGNWQNATTFHRLFTAFTRFSERLIVLESSAPRYDTTVLANELRATFPENTPLHFDDTPVDTSRGAWLRRVRQFIRRGNHETARRLFFQQCGGTPEAFAALVTRLERRVEPVMPTAPLPAESSSSSSSSSMSSVPSAPVQLPDTSPKGRKKRAQTSRNRAPAPLNEAQRVLARIFDPKNTEFAAEIKPLISDTLQDERILSLFSSPVNLLPWMTLEQFGMQFTHKPESVRSSLMYWAFKSASLGRTAFLEALMEQNPKLVNQLCDYLLQLHGNSVPTFDWRYADLRYLMIARKESRGIQALVQKFNAKARLHAVPDMAFDLSLMHIPVEYQRMCVNMLLKPVSTWETYIEELDAASRNWIAYLLQGLQQRAESAKAFWEDIPETGSLMQRIRKFFVKPSQSAIGLLGHVDPLARVQQKMKTCKSPEDMVFFLNQMLNNCGKGWFDYPYILLVVARDGIEAALQKTPAATVAGPSVHPQSFFQSSAVQNQNNFSLELPQLVKGVTLLTLFSSHKGTSEENCSSLMDWFCAPGTEMRLSVLKSTLCDGNPLLTKLFTEVLRQYVLPRQINQRFLDVQCLVAIVDTEIGTEIIEFFARELGILPIDLRLALADYYPPECEAWSKALHNTPESGWKDLALPEVQADDISRYMHVFHRMERIVSASNRRGAVLWKSCMSGSDVRGNVILALALLQLPDSKTSGLERQFAVALSELMGTKEYMGVTHIMQLVEGMLAVLRLPRSGILAGFLRMFRDRFLKTVQTVEALATEADDHLDKALLLVDMQGVDAVLFAQEVEYMRASSGHAKDFLQCLRTEGLLDAERFSKAPRMAFRQMLERALTAPGASLNDINCVRDLLDGLKEDVTSETCAELFLRANSVLDGCAHSFCVSSFFAALMRGITAYAAHNGLIPEAFLTGKVFLEDCAPSSSTARIP